MKTISFMLTPQKKKKHKEELCGWVKWYAEPRGNDKNNRLGICLKLEQILPLNVSLWY